MRFLLSYTPATIKAISKITNTITCQINLGSVGKNRLILDIKCAPVHKEYVEKILKPFM